MTIPHLRTSQSIAVSYLIAVYIHGVMAKVRQRIKKKSVRELLYGLYPIKQFRQLSHWLAPPEHGGSSEAPDEGEQTQESVGQPG